MNLILKDIIIINNDYLNYLRNSDSKVLINHNEGVERPNISVLVDDNGQLWAIPTIIKSFNEYEEIIKQKEKSKNKDYERER